MKYKKKYTDLDMREQTDRVSDLAYQCGYNTALKHVALARQKLQSIPQIIIQAEEILRRNEVEHGKL